MNALYTNLYLLNLPICYAPAFGKSSVRFPPHFIYGFFLHQKATRNIVYHSWKSFHAEIRDTSKNLLTYLMWTIITQTSFEFGQSLPKPVLNFFESSIVKPFTKLYFITVQISCLLTVTPYSTGERSVFTNDLTQINQT